jgi:hypothetical protein
LNDRLEAALDAWQRAARRELDRAIPSVDVLRQIANQGAHLCDIRALLEADPHSQAALRLQEGAQALARGERAWDWLTTLMRPDHEFVVTSRELYETLRTTSRTLANEDQALNRHRLTADLDRGLAAVGNLMALTRSLPDRLLAAHLLRGPAKALRTTDDRLRPRAHGRLVNARERDVPDLTETWRRARYAAAIQIGAAPSAQPLL